MKGMQGGLAAERASRYWPKFLVEAMRTRSCSRSWLVLGWTWDQVRERRRMDEVPRAETMAKTEEKLFRMRHFCRVLACFGMDVTGKGDSRRLRPRSAL